MPCLYANADSCRSGQHYITVDTGTFVISAATLATTSTVQVRVHLGIGDY